jgi:hypothetical protein
MIVGYARVSTAEQNPNPQIDALLRVGVEPCTIHVDHASEAKASRPQWDVPYTKVLRRGDTSKSPGWTASAARCCTWSPSAPSCANAASSCM